MWKGIYLTTLTLAIALGIATICLVQPPVRTQPITTTSTRPAPSTTQPLRVLIPGTTVSFDLIRIPPGKITLSDDQGSRAIHVNSVWIGRTEVTWNEYDLFWQGLDLTRDQLREARDAGSRPSQPYAPPDRGWGHDGFPACGIPEKEAKNYCAWLSRKTGHKYRLPTEAEWEYTCRAGAPTALKPDKANLKQIAWYESNCDGQTQRTGDKKPNAWGLYDMLGNVAEWVTRDPNPSAIAGGSFEDQVADVNSSQREVYTKKLWIGDPADRPPKCWYPSAPQAGFRIVRED